MTIGEAVGERILKLCKDRNLTVNKLATISGITQSTLNNIVSKKPQHYRFHDSEKFVTAGNYHS